jgi:hypothetical protein
MEVVGYNAQLQCTWRQAGRATAGVVASSSSSSCEHRCGYGGGHRRRATIRRGGGGGVVAQGGAAWGVGRRGLELGFKGREEGFVVGLALSEGNGGGDGGGGGGRFGGGGGGGDDDEESDGDAGVPVPQQSSGILAW